MMKISKFAVRIAIFGMSCLVVGLTTPVIPAAFGQALPAAEAAPISTGFALPTSLGSLQYAVSASQSLFWGYYGTGGTASATNLTGDVAYLSNSKQHPFNMVFSGGYSFGESGQQSYSYLNLGVSQVANVGRWNFVLSDSVSYLPGTPTAGLSGVPGVGDVGVNPVQVGGDTGQGVLTDDSDRVGNTAAGSVSRQITGKTSLNASGSYEILRFLSGSLASANSSSAGLDGDSATGSVGIRHEVDARSSFGGNYAYSDYSYTGNSFGVAEPGFVSQTVSAFFVHQFTRKLSFSAAAGPQWTTIVGSASGPTYGSGAALSLFADVSAGYAGKSTTSSLVFTRSTDGGFGATGGGIASSVVLGVNRRFATVWNLSVSSAYTQTSSLPVAGIPPYTFNTYVDTVQISRALARSLSAFASYTLEDQHFSGSSAVDVFTGLEQVVGFGITYSPTALHLGRQ
jgi:hypothetical protein